MFELSSHNVFVLACGQWSFEDYLPVFRLARQSGIPLVALNVDSASMEKVRVGGFENLPQESRDLYVEDKKGFIAFSRTPGFRDYVEVSVVVVVVVVVVGFIVW